MKCVQHFILRGVRKFSGTAYYDEICTGDAGIYVSMIIPGLKYRKLPIHFFDNTSDRFSLYSLF